MKSKTKLKKQKFSGKLMWQQRYLLLMSVPFVIWLIIFKYIPLWGWTMAFQEVTPKSFAQPIWERGFSGFANFTKAFTDRLFAQTMINTIGTSLLGILLGTVCAIIFALMLTEWVGMSRIARAEMLKLKEQEFVLASRTLGAGNFFIIF